MLNFLKSSLPLFILASSLCVRLSSQPSASAAQDSPAGDTADLLGLNADSEPPNPPMSSSSSSAPHQGVQGGLKAASSNSDLLNDLFAPPAGQTGAVQEDLFFSGAPSGATPDSKRKARGFIHADCIKKKICL